MMLMRSLCGKELHENTPSYAAYNLYHNLFEFIALPVNARGWRVTRIRKGIEAFIPLNVGGSGEDGAPIGFILWGGEGSAIEEVLVKQSPVTLGELACQLRIFYQGRSAKRRLFGRFSSAIDPLIEKHSGLIIRPE